MSGPAADNALCARCGGPFHCGADDPGPCACTSVKLDAATLAALRGQYTGCLCLRCLAGMAGQAVATTPVAPPAPPGAAPPS